MSKFIQTVRQITLAACLLLVAHAAVAQTSDEKEIENWDGALQSASTDFKGLSNKNKEAVSNTGTSTMSKLIKLLSELSIKYNVGTNIGIIDGLKVKVKNTQRIEPSFYGKYFSRSDKWEIRPQANFLELAGVDTPAQFNISTGLEVEFNQFYENYEDALNPLNMYTPLHLPLTSEKALNHLKPGDLVSLDGEMSLFYGYRDSFKYVSDQIKVVPTVGGVFSGHFRVYVFRGDRDRIRLRIGAIRNNPKFIKVEVGLLDLFDLGWNPLTKLVTNFLKLKNIAELKFERYNRDTLLTDFTLDMTDPRVQDAYNEIFQLDTQSDTLLVTANPLTSDKDLRDSLYINVQKLIDLSVETSKDINPAVIMNFGGSNFSVGNLNLMNGGASLLASGKNENMSQQNNLKQVTYNSDGTSEDHYYVFPSWSKKHEHSALATKWEEKDTVNSNIIYQADENYNIVKFNNIGYYHDYTDKEFSQKENEKILAGYKKVLPEDVNNEFTAFLNANNWNNFKKRKNVRITGRYFIHEDGLQYGNDRSSAELEARLLAAVQELDAESNRVLRLGSDMTREIRCLKKYGYTPSGKGSNRAYRVGPNIFEYCDQIAKTAEKLQDAMNTRRSKNDRNKSFISLTRSSLFQLFGPGILFGMIPKDRLNEVSYFEITINSSGLKQPLAYHFGEIRDRKLLEIMFQIDNIMSDNLPDLRLTGTTEDTVTRIYGGNGN